MTQRWELEHVCKGKADKAFPEYQALCDIIIVHHKGRAGDRKVIAEKSQIYTDSFQNVRLLSKRCYILAI